MVFAPSYSRRSRSYARTSSIPGNINCLLRVLEYEYHASLRRRHQTPRRGGSSDGVGAGPRTAARHLRGHRGNRHESAHQAAVSRIRANLASRSTEAAEGERIPRAKFIAVLEDFYRRANPDKVANAGTIGWMIDYYEGCEELLYERLEQRYESVPGGPFKVWRDAAPAEPEL